MTATGPLLLRSCLTSAVLTGSLLLGGCGAADDDGASAETDTDGTGGDTELEPDPIDPSDTGSPNEPTNPDLYDGGAYWRIDVTKTFSTNTVAIGEVIRVDITAGDHDPLPSVAGDYMVVAYAGDEVMSARPVHFANAGRVESELEGGGMVLDVVMIDESPATTFVPLDETVTRIEVQDGNGAVVAEVGADALPLMSFRNYQNPISNRFPHIAVFGAGDEGRLPTAYYAEGHIESVVEPTDEQYARILAELEQLAPAVRSAMTAVAVVRAPNEGCKSVGSANGSGCGYGEDGVAKVTPGCEDLAQTDGDGNPLPTGRVSGAAIGSYLVLNEQTFPWNGTVIHEGVHNFTNLMDGRQADAANWSPAVVTEARELIRDYRLGTNLTRTWYQLHKSAYDAVPGEFLEPPEPPTGVFPGWCNVSEQDAVDGGFPTPYGMYSTYEDIADYVARVVIDGAAAPVCAQFGAAYVGDFPDRLTVAYAKLALLHQLGALTKQQFDDCTQDAKIGRDSEGIELGDQVFTSDLKAGYYDGANTRYFAILGQGVEQWQLLYEASVEEGESPLGVHKFGSISGLSLALFGIPENGVYLNHPDTPRASDSGLLIITEASSERVMGAVFHLTLQNAFGVNTSYDAYAPFLIGEPLP